MGTGDSFTFLLNSFSQILWPDITSVQAACFHRFLFKG